jgi:hypothetical protein
MRHAEGSGGTLGIPEEVDRTDRYRRFVADPDAHQATTVFRIAESDLAHGGMGEREVHRIALFVERARIPATSLLTLRMPAVVQIEALVVDLRDADNALQARRAARRAPLALARCERRARNAQCYALCARGAGGTKVDGAKASPSARKKLFELRRGDIDLDANVELGVAIGQVRARVRGLDELLEQAGHATLLHRPPGNVNLAAYRPPACVRERDGERYRLSARRFVPPPS